MREYEKISEKKQREIDATLRQPAEVGESVYIKNKYIGTYYNSKKKFTDEEFNRDVLFEVKSVNENDYSIECCERGCDAILIPFGDYNRCIEISNAGANPFHKGKNIRNTGYNLESILHQLGLLGGSRREEYFLKETNGEGVKSVNWNPFVVDENGNKHYYQRDFCWGLEDKQLLIESIYNGIDCGKVIIRPRKWEWIEEHVRNATYHDIAWYDIVDGKQRLKTVHEFINDEFPDKHGNFYSDLSGRSQRALLDHQLLGSSQFEEDVTDKDVIETFIRLNIFGKVVEKKHMETVEKINKILK